MKKIKTLYKRNKDVFYNLVITELKLKYKNSILGFLWTLLEPLLIAMTFLWVFTKLFTNNLANFPAYILTGFTAWFFLNNGTNMLEVLVNKSDLIKKISISKLLLILSSGVVSFINSIFEFSILIIILIFLKVGISWTIIFLPLLLILQFIFIMNILTILSILYVYIRDIHHFWNIFLQIWFFLTPIVYPQSLIAKKTSVILTINPMLHFITAYRNILVYHHPLTINCFLILIIITSSTFAIAYLIFKKLSPKIAEEV